MRFIIYGTGAIGGTFAARLALSGYTVTGIARGPHLAAIRDAGLTLRTPADTHVVSLDCVADPGEIDFKPDDVIFLTMKTQDTPAALARLRAVGVQEQAIVCAQNGVANERFGLRLFPNIYGMMMLMPASHMVPGEVNAFGAPKLGVLDIGRYPSGCNDVAEGVAHALGASGFAASTTTDVMQSKYAKLLMNLGNIVHAVMDKGDACTAMTERVRGEGAAVLRAAGIAFGADSGQDQRRKTEMQEKDIKGVSRIGSSSAQSLARNAGSIETDYLNGEIVLLGRLKGIETPANAYLTRLAQDLVSGRVKRADISAEQILAGAGL